MNTHDMKDRPASPRRRPIGLAAAVAMAAAVTSPAALIVGVDAEHLIPTAVALPPGGAGANTPGTSSSVEPSTLAPCETLTYTVSGFPAGEIVYVKINDGEGMGNSAIQGAGVVAQQRIGSDGTARGSVEIPCDFDQGGHTLRFLATESFGDDGESRGYTNRSPEFTVTNARDEENENTAGGADTAGDPSRSGGGDSGGADAASPGAAAGAAAGGARSPGAATASTGSDDGGSDNSQAGAAPRSTVVRPGAAAAASRNGSSGSTGAGTSTGGQSGGGALGFDGAGGGSVDAALLADSRRSDVPIFGLIVAGAILVVGLGIIATLAGFLWTRRVDSAGNSLRSNPPADHGYGAADSHYGLP